MLMCPGIGLLSLLLCLSSALLPRITLSKKLLSHKPLSQALLWVTQARKTTDQESEKEMGMSSLEGILNSASRCREQGLLRTNGETIPILCFGGW